MQKNKLINIAIIGGAAIIIFGIFQQIVGFNNYMISLEEMKKAEIETTKVEYGQCIVKIMEVNKVAKAYTQDVFNLADKAGKNLEQFDNNLIALIGTQIIPQLSPELRLTVQKEIISCRNAYTGRVDLGLKPMYVNFNLEQRKFPNNIYNALFFNWKPDELIMPKNEAANEAFESGEVKVLDLN